MRVVMALLVSLLGSVLLLSTPSEAAEPDVSVESGTGFSKAQVAEIRELVADAKTPSQVLILRRLPRSANGSPHMHAKHLEAARATEPGQATLTLVFSPHSLPEFGAVATTSKEVRNLFYSLEVAERLDATPQEVFVELVRMSTTRTGARRFDEQMAERWDEDFDSDSDDTTADPPSTGTKVMRWIVIAVAVLMLVLLLLFRGRAVAGWWRRRRRTRDLAGAAELARVKGLFDQAKADVLAFGQAIDAEGLDGNDGLELWRLALADYDEASRLLDARSGPADDKAVIEICARGRDRLAKAQR